MKVYCARQAILNRKKQTVAYELFFREGFENAFPVGTNPDVATSRLVLNQHLNVGFKSHTRGKRALVNFSEQGILDGSPTLLAPDDIIIEVLEDVPPSDELYNACRDLFHQGYKLALDDFLYHHNWERFINFSRLIKFDIQRTPLDEVAVILPKIRQRKNLKILAEKVETYEEFAQAKKMGFDYFQGYFFCQPEMLVTSDIEAEHHIILAIYQQVLKPNIDYEKLSHFFERDLALSYKLMRFINSGLFQLREPIDSIKQALVYLGEEQARRFVCLLATAHLGTDKPKELIRMSIIRARFCELVAIGINRKNSDQSFMTGLFSMVDALLNRTMEEIITKLPLAEDVTNALLGDNSPLLHQLNLVKAYESGSWYWTQKRANAVGIEQDKLPELYSQATQWAESYEFEGESNGNHSKPFVN